MPSHVLIPTTIAAHDMKDPISPPQALISLLQPASDKLSLTTLPLHLHEILLAWGTYSLIHRHGAPLLSRHLLPTHYANLGARARLNWDVRIVSFIQAVFVSTATLLVVFSDEERAQMDWRGRIWGYTGASGLVQACAAGYFAWDVVVSVLYLPMLGPGSLAHAISALLITMLGFVSLWVLVWGMVLRNGKWLTGKSSVPLQTTMG